MMEVLETPESDAILSAAEFIGIEPERMAAAIEHYKGYKKQQIDDQLRQLIYNNISINLPGEAADKSARNILNALQPHLKSSDRESINQKMVNFINDLATRPTAPSHDDTTVFKHWVQAAKDLLNSTEGQKP